MYKEHVPLIAEGMRADPDVFMRGIMFAVLSIQQPVTGVPRQLADIDRGELKWVWGHKREAYDYLQEHGCALWRDVVSVPSRGTENARVVITMLCRVPGLGIVKAAFVAQFLAHDVACLDTRNVNTDGRNPLETRADKKSGPAFDAKVARYVAETYGRAQFFWDRWCKEAGDYFEKTASGGNRMRKYKALVSVRQMGAIGRWETREISYDAPTADHMYALREIYARGWEPNHVRNVRPA